MRKAHFRPRGGYGAGGGVGKDDELAHDGGDRDFGGLSGFDELLVERSAVFIEPASDERRHLKGLAKGIFLETWSRSTLNEPVQRCAQGYRSSRPFGSWSLAFQRSRGASGSRGWVFVVAVRSRKVRFR
jgi:hypothetical protein